MCNCDWCKTYQSETDSKVLLDLLLQMERYDGRYNSRPEFHPLPGHSIVQKTALYDEIIRRLSINQEVA